MRRPSNLRKVTFGMKMCPGQCSKWSKITTESSLRSRVAMMKIAFSNSCTKASRGWLTMMRASPFTISNQSRRYPWRSQVTSNTVLKLLSQRKSRLLKSRTIPLRSHSGREAIQPELSQLKIRWPSLSQRSFKSGGSRAVGSLELT